MNSLLTGLGWQSDAQQCCKTTHSSAWTALFSNEGWLQNDAQQCMGGAVF